MPDPHIELILKYMTSQNRPYSSQNVYDNLRGEVPKLKVVNALDACLADGTLFMKSYGAQKIYCIPQPESKQSESFDNTVEVFQERLAELNIVRRQLQDQFDEIGRKLSMHAQVKSVDVARTQCLARITEFHNQIEVIENSRSGNKSNYDKDTGDKIELEISSLMIELSKRRRMAMNMVEQISEFSCISKKEVISDLGLETEAVGVFRGE